MVSLSRILCPVDFSESSAHAIAHAAAIARGYGAAITALHVHQNDFADGPEIEALRAQVCDAFSRGAAGLQVDVLVDVGRPVQQILERAASLPADVIVIGTHGAGGFERFVLGSVAEKVLRKSSCPVLTVPPRAQATSQLPFTRIVCAVDLSDCSADALRYACSLASGAGSNVTAVHVIDWPWEEKDAERELLLPEHAETLREYQQYLERGAIARLEALAEGEAAGCAFGVRTTFGRPYVEILRVADELRADLIVMGVHGRNAVDLKVFGSTASAVVRRATCPVLTLRRPR